jgi:hypothetical protein
MRWTCLTMTAAMVGVACGPDWTEPSDGPGLIGPREAWPDDDAPVPVLDPPALDFESLAPGRNARRTIELRNEGTAPFRVLSAEVNDEGEFYGLGYPSGEIDPGRRLTYDVVFAPMAEGPREDTLSITTDIGDGEVLRVPLTGFGDP